MNEKFESILDINASLTQKINLIEQKVKRSVDMQEDIVSTMQKREVDRSKRDADWRKKQLARQKLIYQASLKSPTNNGALSKSFGFNHENQPYFSHFRRNTTFVDNEYSPLNIEIMADNDHTIKSNTPLIESATNLQQIKDDQIPSSIMKKEYIISEKDYECGQ